MEAGWCFKNYNKKIGVRVTTFFIYLVFIGEVGIIFTLYFVCRRRSLGGIDRRAITFSLGLGFV